MARAPVLFFGLELPDTIVYNRSEAFVDFNFREVKSFSIMPAELGKVFKRGMILHS